MREEGKFHARQALLYRLLLGKRKSRAERRALPVFPSAAAGVH